MCYLGDAANNTANSLLVTGALLGMDVRIVGPETLLPSPPVRTTARALGERSDARISIGNDAASAVKGADFLYTDVWVSMGEPPPIGMSASTRCCPSRSTPISWPPPATPR